MVCCPSDHYSLLNPNKTITSKKYAQHIAEVHWKLQRLQLASFTRRSPKAPWQCPTACQTTNTSKVEWIGLQRFASPTIFTWPLTNRLPLLQASQKLFAGKMLPQSSGGRKCFPRVRRNPKHNFHTQEETNLFLVGKNVLMVMVPILINKDVFEPSYNDLKFTVRNHTFSPSQNTWDGKSLPFPWEKCMLYLPKWVIYKPAFCYQVGNSSTSNLLLSYLLALWVLGTEILFS